jgi:metal-sulfur cluster biosynthetic enzyme
MPKEQKKVPFSDNPLWTQSMISEEGKMKLGLI